jgi:hypothetical protein
VSSRSVTRGRGLALRPSFMLLVLRDMLVGYAWSVDCSMEFLGWNYLGFVDRYRLRHGRSFHCSLLVAHGALVAQRRM